jgi:hypothetical protein
VNNKIEHRNIVAYGGFKKRKALVDTRSTGCKTQQLSLKRINITKKHFRAILNIVFIVYEHNFQDEFKKRQGTTVALNF